MKKRITAILAVWMLLGSMISVCAAPTYQVPEAFMGFSVPNGWYVFSKNMEDEELLKAADVTVEEVNETLLKSGCEQIIINPEENSEIYVSVKENEVTEHYYNILETEDEVIQAELNRMLKDGFLVDQFDYLPEEVVITPYAQMKFVTIPGTAQYDGKRVGMVFGFTFVNGSGIAFMMHTDTETPGGSDVALVQDIASSVSFTVIKEKGEDAAPAEEVTEETENAPHPVGYIVGGMVAIALAALCLILIRRMRNTDANSGNDEE